MNRINKLPIRDVIYKNQEFIISHYDYNLQYFPYYRARLAEMKKNLSWNARNIWPGIPIYSLNELADNKLKTNDIVSQDIGEQDNMMMIGRDIVVMGILLKKMPAQPNILKEIDDERKLMEPLSKDDQVINNYVTNNDILFLQNDDECIELKGDISTDQFCNGICLAVKGQINPIGSGFIVQDFCFSSPKCLPSPRNFITNKDYYVLIISGLSLTNNLNSSPKLASSLNILFDIVTGNSDLILDKTIVNLILAGNNIDSLTRIKPSLSSTNGEHWNQSLPSNSSCQAIKNLDTLLANIGQYMFVDVMPGHNDLCTFLWPQQPIHPSLLPKSYRLNTIKSVTNPHRALYYGVEFFGTSGENVDSIRACTNLYEPLEIMRNILKWSHLAPTCPDSLHSYPFSNHDPLVLNSYPDVFFVGNQKDFGIGSFESPDGEKKVCLISVPTFSEKFIGVLVNLRTLNCEMLAFN